MRTLSCIVVALAAPLLAAPDDEAFFRERIEPLLRDRCFECHSHEGGKMKGGLTLDSRSGWEEGGDSGPALVPGNVEASLLVKAVRRGDPDKAMPPKKPLPAAEVELLAEWVKRGAPDPRAKTVRKLDSNWWSLRPLAPARASASIDSFIDARLAVERITPAPCADRRTLIRRLYLDLHGMVPTIQEVEAFVADPDPAAYDKLVDRLLASPRYGERWARHWFDSIHFADTHGFEHDRLRDHAWRYRDYVIGALNRDVPWARFIREQLAADVFFPAERALTPALGFLGAGPYDQSAADTAPKMFEVVDRDDMLVQTMAAFTSTTAGCARCHDHKFDPISQEEYYSLAAVFAGVVKGDISFDEDPAAAHERERWTRIRDAAAKGDRAVLLGDEMDRMVAAWDVGRGKPAKWTMLTPIEFTSAGGAQLERLDDGSVLSGGNRPDTETLTVTAEVFAGDVTAVRLEVLTDDDLPHYGPGRQDNGNLHLSEFELYALEPGKDMRRIAIRGAVADFDQEGWTISHALDGNEKSAWGIYPKVGEPHQAVFELAQKLSLPAGAKLRMVLKQVHGMGHVIGRARFAITADAAATALPLPGHVEQARSVDRTRRTEAMRLTLAKYVAAVSSAAALAKIPAQARVYAAGTVVDRHGKAVVRPEPVEIRVLKRGDLNKPGDVVSPGALECVAELQPRFAVDPAKGEGARRAALADWIADARNPLTWRSIVNRVWRYHFGKGIVDTPNDIGRMGGLPSHPELLDWLAVDFRDHGGSLKRLHRMIVTSAAWKRESDGIPFAADADNRLLARGNRQRLDAESFRDIVLQVSGRLDLTMGGPAVMHFKLGPAIQDTPTLDYRAHDWDAPGACRRSIYRLVYRNIADPFMAALDFPDAAQLAPTRPFSASALQALALWNDDFVLRQSEHFAERVEKMAPDPNGRVRAAVRLALLREPTAEEVRGFLAFVAKHGIAALGRALFNSNEFMFVD